MNITYLLENHVLLVMAILTAVLGVGRLTRIIYWDSFPPAMAFREAWDKATDGSSWNKLFHCPWCLAPWIMLICIGWFFLGQLAVPVAILWWLFWGWLALSYVATMIIVRDEPTG